MSRIDKGLPHLYYNSKEYVRVQTSNTRNNRITIIQIHVRIVSLHTQNFILLILVHTQKQN